MECDQELPQMPFPRHGVLEPSPMYRTLQTTAPVTRVRTEVGDVAWLVTGHAAASALFQDRRLRRSHPEPELAAKITGSAVAGGPMMDSDTEEEQHAQMRRLLTPAFSARRMRMLRDRVTQLVDELLTKIQNVGPPVDLHEMLSFQLPVLMICELLGVPADDREKFGELSNALNSVADPAGAFAAAQQLAAYMHGLIERKRAAPGNDLISDAIAAQRDEGYDDDDVAELGAAMLFVGHETTVAQIDYGVLLFGDNVEQYERLRADPELLDGAVEEILRMASPGVGGGVPRYAGSDIDVAGVRIATGDAVLLAAAVANRDPAAFPEPDVFDITRSPNPHLSFGHGGRYCPGASLARVELRSVFDALPRRLPALRVAVPMNQLRLRRDTLTGGLAELPITW